ncbi:uncharacterized protein CTRU02_214759 [Colletotrichum truncatum]|uniref:Uncharacterized protein n=1 Tax=Colletotrichum truncatum TaxID=5467 RepID=A0ACC3YFP5_COLTU
MRVNTAAIITALIASVSAAPVTGGNGIDAEELIINDFAARHQQDGSVVSVGLHITGHDATNLECSKTDGVVLGEVYNCGDSKYSFSLVKGRFDTWGVHVYHRWGVASGVSGYRDVPTICRAGPLQTTDCTRTTPVWFYIGSV